jgi:predicted nuclease of predicted toxin-antitoxin system
MVANERKSKRRSAASSTSPPEPLAFFTDANLGRRVVPEALRAIGEEVKTHDEIFSPGTHDRVWLLAAGEKGWVVLTKDSKIRYRRNEIAAFLSARVRVFVLVSRNLPGAEMGRVFVKALPAIKKLCASHSAPFIAHIHLDGTVVLMKS